MDARLHLLTALFGGRQSARTVHFVTATALVLFFLIHILAVLAAGPLTEMRSIVTGWFVIKPDRKSS
jgi:thiosulfate reductase cytochrome b subunit